MNRIGGCLMEGTGLTKLENEDFKQYWEKNSGKWAESWLMDRMVKSLRHMHNSLYSVTFSVPTESCYRILFRRRFLYHVNLTVPPLIGALLWERKHPPLSGPWGASKPGLVLQELFHFHFCITIVVFLLTLKNMIGVRWFTMFHLLLLYSKVKQVNTHLYIPTLSLYSFPI